MRKIFFIYIFLLCTCIGANAQKFYVPDANFRTFLQNNYLSCFIGDSLDTQCDLVINETAMNCSGQNIADMSGIAFFVNLKDLNISNNKITGSFSYLKDINTLDCSNNQIGPLLEVGKIDKLRTYNNNIFHFSKTLDFTSTIDIRNNQISNLCEVAYYTIDSLFVSNNRIITSSCISRKTSCYMYSPTYLDIQCGFCPDVNLEVIAFEDKNYNNVYDNNEALVYPDVYVDNRLVFLHAANSYYLEFEDPSINSKSVAISLPLGYETTLSDLTRQVANTGCYYDYTPTEKLYYPLRKKTSPAFIELVSKTILFPGRIFTCELFFEDKTGLHPDGTIELLFDKRLVFEQSSTNPILVAENKLTWQYSISDTSKVQSILVEFIAPQNFQAGQTIKSEAIIKPNDFDSDTSDNHSTIIDMVRNSYDPNDKSVVPLNDIFYSDLELNTNLEYTIRFQNTGTANAFDIKIIDTLDNNLDMNTIKTVVTSHGYILHLNENIATWTFDNIYLPDSNSNEAESHGFIKYRIKPKTTLKVGDEIRNTANIYFDFNPAVVTNTTVTKIINPIVTEFETVYSELETVKVFPNPSKGYLNIFTRQACNLEITDISGQLLYEQQIEGQNQQVDISDLKAGTYLYRFTTNDGVKFGKVVKQ